MKKILTDIPDVFIIQPDVFADERGYFKETYNIKRYFDIGIGEQFKQDNISVSKKNVLRGLHYQVGEYAQGKLVQVLKGRVLDVAVDIRFKSPTFGKYVAVELSADNHLQMWIPVGFAHGFVALEDDTIFSYKCTKVYSKMHERCIRYDDEELNIDWKVKNPIVSEKDLQGIKFDDIKEDFIYKKS